MCVRFHFLLLFFILPAFCSFGQSFEFDFNKACLDIYDRSMALDNDALEILLEKEKRHYPQNIIPYYLEDYRDCLELLFNGDSKRYAVLKSGESKRLSLIEKGSHHSPWYRFCKANIYLHWALVHLRFGEQFKAAGKFRRSFMLLHENDQLFPDFRENKVLLGLEQAIAGAVPENYQWLTALFGVKGNIKRGVEQIGVYIEECQGVNTPMLEEAKIYWAYLNFYLLNEQEKAWSFINRNSYVAENHLLHSFIKSNLALNYRKADVATEILKKAFTIKSVTDYPVFYYEMGEALLMQAEPDALRYYNSFLNHYRGNHFVKDTWLKKAWIAYLSDDVKERERCLSQIKSRGGTQTDADKQALRFAEKPVWPMKSLLEIRLLIDGGEYRKAQQKIEKIPKQSLVSMENILEYNFRYGRILEELHKPEKAIIFYNAVITSGKNRKEYFAARAALQQGFIYEKQKKYGDAKAAYKECLEMRNHDFQASIDQQAKAGLNRLGE